MITQFQSKQSTRHQQRDSIQASPIMGFQNDWKAVYLVLEAILTSIIRRATMNGKRFWLVGNNNKKENYMLVLLLLAGIFIVLLLIMFSASDPKKETSRRGFA